MIPGLKKHSHCVLCPNQPLGILMGELAMFASRYLSRPGTQRDPMVDRGQWNKTEAGLQLSDPFAGWIGRTCFVNIQN
jgi:hypothetical protein